MFDPVLLERVFDPPRDPSHFEGASSGSGAVLTFGDEPLMFHTGLRKMSPLNRDASSRIMPAEHLGWVRCC
jgi:hypothetical protein